MINLFKMKFGYRKFKYMVQRIKYGFCEDDTYEIDTWFLQVMPKMLETFKEKKISYPDYLRDGYYNKSVEKPLVAQHTVEYNPIIGEEESHDDSSEYARNKWNQILSEMSNLFTKAQKNPGTTLGDPNEKQRQEYLKQAFGLFIKYFNDLWW